MVEQEILAGQYGVAQRSIHSLQTSISFLNIFYQKYTTEDRQELKTCYFYDTGNMNVNKNSCNNYSFLELKKVGGGQLVG